MWIRMSTILASGETPGVGLGADSWGFGVDVRTSQPQGDSVEAADSWQPTRSPAEVTFAMVIRLLSLEPSWWMLRAVQKELETTDDPG
jgi:hypothetical protein